MPHHRLIFCRAMFVLTLFCLVPEPAQAHRVYIFAWPENGLICTESYFNKRAKVQGGEVRMLDASENLLAQGVSDATGICCFEPPQDPQALTFVVAGGEGHKGSILLPLEQVLEAFPPSGASHASSAPPASGQATREAASPLPLLPAPEVPPDPAATEVDTALLRAIVREEIQSQLAPVRKELAALGAAGSPGFKDIVGGLGWIAGLAAVGVFVQRRRER